eukprot:m.215867 g.215867  ORF g.215867 m.215867 type:complete len:159 (-) comp18646_c0_seq7:134-610(-)
MPGPSITFTHDMPTMASMSHMTTKDDWDMTADRSKGVRHPYRHKQAQVLCLAGDRVAQQGDTRMATTLYKEAASIYDRLDDDDESVVDTPRQDVYEDEMQLTQTLQDIAKSTKWASPAQEQRVMDDALLVTKQTNNTAAAALAGTATPIDISESKDSN